MSQAEGAEMHQSAVDAVPNIKMEHILRPETTTEPMATPSSAPYTPAQPRKRSAEVHVGNLRSRISTPIPLQFKIEDSEEDDSIADDTALVPVNTSSRQPSAAASTAPSSPTYYHSSSSNSSSSGNFQLSPAAEAAYNSHPFGWKPACGQASAAGKKRAREAAQEWAHTLSLQGRHAFEKAMSESQVSGGFWMQLPAKITPFYGLTKRDITLHCDHRGMASTDPATASHSQNLPPGQWAVVYLPKNGPNAAGSTTPGSAGRGGCGLSGGWRGFAIDQRLSPADTVVFEVLDHPTGNTNDYSYYVQPDQRMHLQAHIFRGALYEREDADQQQHQQQQQQLVPGTPARSIPFPTAAGADTPDRADTEVDRGGSGEASPAAVAAAAAGDSTGAQLEQALPSTAAAAAAVVTTATAAAAEVEVIVVSDSLEEEEDDAAAAAGPSATAGAAGISLPVGYSLQPFTNIGAAFGQLLQLLDLLEPEKRATPLQLQQLQAGLKRLEGLPEGHNKITVMKTRYEIVQRWMAIQDVVNARQAVGDLLAAALA